MKATIYAEITVGVKVNIEVDDFDNEAEDAVYELCNDNLVFINRSNGRIVKENIVIDVRGVNHFENIEIGD